MGHNTRFIEIDFIKGLALITMVIFHFFFLSGQMNIKSYNSPILPLLAKFAHYTFITMAGLNMATSIAGKDKKTYRLRKMKRGLQLIVLGLIISYATKLEFGDKYVKFGIMHFIGTATIVGSFYANIPWVSLIIAIVIFLVHILLVNGGLRTHFYEFCSNNPFFCFVSGILNIKYNSIDHFSIIPFLGVFSLGIVFAHILYKIKDGNKNIEKNDNNTPKLTRKYKFLGILDKYKDNVIVKNICWLGQRSLEIYVIHFVLFWAYFKTQQPDSDTTINDIILNE